MAEEVGMRLKLLLILPLILALLTLSSPVVAWDEPWPYDADDDGIISKSEALVAVADYFSGDITKAQALEVIALYFAYEVG